MVHLEGAQTDALDRLDHEMRQIIRRDPVPQIGRKQKRLVPITVNEVAPLTVVWLAERFRDEHRAALDWLNEITHEDSRFFGLEIELWQIGDSPAAPKFNIVSKPNDWSRSVAQAARAADDSELSELRLTQRKYWTGLLERLNAVGGELWPEVGDGVKG